MMTMPVMVNMVNNGHNRDGYDEQLYEGGYFSLEIFPSVQWKHIARNEMGLEGANNLQRGNSNDAEMIML